MLILKLDCGRKIMVDAFDYSRTYSGLMMGRPDAEMNDRIIESVLSSRESSWGKRKVYLIPPAIDSRDPDHPVLPPVCLRAWVWCNDPIDSSYMGSELVIVWFAEESHAEPIADIVFRAIRALPWDELAEDFVW